MKESNMDTLVSIVIPVYNVENYLEECLDSIVNQTYHNIEIIIVNDGSTDKSGEICKNYKLRDERIVLFEQKNQGLSAARNVGIEHAKGYWITFVDSDDHVSYDYIEQFLKHAYNGVDVVICDRLSFYEDDRVRNPIYTNDAKVLDKTSALENLYNEYHETFVTAWGKLYKMSLYEGIRFPAGRIHEDLYTTYLIYGSSNKIVYLRNQMYYYRQRDGSIMNSRFNLKRLDALEGLYNMMIYVLEIPGFAKRNNVVAEYIEKLIYFYYKVTEVCDVICEEYQTKLKNETKKLFIRYFNLFYLKDKLKFLLFIFSPKLFKLVRERLKK